MPVTKTIKLQDGRSKKRPGIEEQAEIITAAAIALFIEQGTRNTSITQICTKADVSKPTFYRCFADKEELVARLYQHSINDHVESLLASTFSNARGDKSGMDKALDELLDAIFERAELAQLLFREYSDPGSPAAQIIDDAFDRIARKMEKDFKQFARPQPSRTFLKAMMSAFQWIVHDAIKSGLSNKKVKDAKQAAHELASALLSQI